MNNELAQYTTTPRTTTQQMPASDQVTCNFDENNKCGWLDDTTGEVKWTLNKGSTLSADTGPSTDVSGKGYYIYLETSNVKEGNKARILSPLINATLAKNERNINLITFNLILCQIICLFVFG